MGAFTVADVAWLVSIVAVVVLLDRLSVLLVHSEQRRAVKVGPGPEQGGTRSDRPGVSDAAPAAPPSATSSASGGCGTAAIPAAASAGDLAVAMDESDASAEHRIGGEVRV